VDSGEETYVGRCMSEFMADGFLGSSARTLGIVLTETSRLYFMFLFT
jgi:hypothetical protein